MLFLAKCLVKITSKTFFALALTSGFGAAICVAGVHTSFALGKSASAGHNVMAASSCLGAAACVRKFFLQLGIVNLIEVAASRLRW